MTAVCDACLDGRCEACEMYADLDEMEDGATADFWEGTCCCSVVDAPLASEAPTNPRCYGCGERITRDEQGHWSADDGAGGWFYMCAAMGHQDQHAPASNPRDGAS